MPTVEALRHVDEVLDSVLGAAVEQLRQRGADPSEIPFSASMPAPLLTRQKRLVEATCQVARDGIMESLSEAARARLRSASGSGSSSYLLLPTQQDHHVEDYLFRAAVAKRLGGTVKPKDEANRTCSLHGRDGRCGMHLDEDTVHANQCKCGGHVVRRHDRVVRWLAGWLGDGRVGSEVLMEQVVPSAECPDGRLDITFDANGRRVWIDVAVVTVATIDARHRARRPKVDGSAAQDEEVHKRSRYRSLATPFVIEALGRPGDKARGVIGAYARDWGQGQSADAASAWQSLSAIIQAESADHELRACGWTPDNRGEARFSFEAA